MELNDIETLVEKYLNATTTLAEEEKLRTYFSQEHVAKPLEQYQEMFQYFSTAKEERSTKQLPMRSTTDYKKWIGVAAAVLVAFGLYFGVSSYRENKAVQQKEALYAYKQTKKALALLSYNMHKGTQKFSYLNEFEYAKQKIYKN